MKKARRGRGVGGSQLAANASASSNINHYTKSNHTNVRMRVTGVHTHAYDYMHMHVHALEHVNSTEKSQKIRSYFPAFPNNALSPPPRPSHTISNTCARGLRVRTRAHMPHTRDRAHTRCTTYQNTSALKLTRPVAKSI